MALLAKLVGKVPCTVRLLLIYTVLTGVFFLYSQVSALQILLFFLGDADVRLRLRAGVWCRRCH